MYKGENFMKFGYFDFKNKEYVIINLKIFIFWVNYFGIVDYCFIIFNNVFGYLFYKFFKFGRVICFRFNSILMDRFGRYVYIKDEKIKDFWLISWQFVVKFFESFKSICCYGFGYFIFESSYDLIIFFFKIFVLIDKFIEIWEVRVKNELNEVKEFLFFIYIEFCFWNLMLDMMDF